MGESQKLGMMHLLHELSFVAQTRSSTLPLTLSTDTSPRTAGSKGQQLDSTEEGIRRQRHCFLEPGPPLRAREYYPSSLNFIFKIMTQNFPWIPEIYFKY